jgi:hypothetical protein
MLLLTICCNIAVSCGKKKVPELKKLYISGNWLCSEYTRSGSVLENCDSLLNGGHVDRIYNAVNVVEAPL